MNEIMDCYVFALCICTMDLDQLTCLPILNDNWELFWFITCSAYNFKWKFLRPLLKFDEGKSLIMFSIYSLFFFIEFIFSPIHNFSDPRFSQFQVNMPSFHVLFTNQTETTPIMCHFSFLIKQFWEWGIELWTYDALLTLKTI